MRTIIVQFDGEGPNYCFKTADEGLKVGDVLISPNYDASMVVKDVINKDYTYVNILTGEFSNELTSTKCSRIKTLLIREDPDIVYACKYNPV